MRRRFLLLRAGRDRGGVGRHGADDQVRSCAARRWLVAEHPVVHGSLGAERDVGAQDAVPDSGHHEQTPLMESRHDVGRTGRRRAHVEAAAHCEHGDVGKRPRAERGAACGNGPLQAQGRIAQGGGPRAERAQRASRQRADRGGEERWAIGDRSVRLPGERAVPADRRREEAGAEVLVRHDRAFGVELEEAEQRLKGSEARRVHRRRELCGEAWAQVRVDDQRKEGETVDPLRLRRSVHLEHLDVGRLRRKAVRQRNHVTCEV